jgi:DNA-binding response OmpR family regulator
MTMGAGKRLLIVDNDVILLGVLKDLFEDEGYEVVVFEDAPDVLRHVAQHGLPHLALVDLGLDSMHGFELSQKLKMMGDLPIVFITGDESPETVVNGLIHYADDYLIKPFQLRELAARVRRILSRIYEFDYVQQPMIEIDEHIAVDFGKSKLMVDGEAVVLTPTELGLLHVLIRNAGRVVTSETLIARVWPGDEVYEDTLRVHMHRLRRKLEPDIHHPKYIQTERGIGYRFLLLDLKAIKSVPAN